MNYTEIKLGELLSHTNEIIKRNAMSILKTLQKSVDSADICEMAHDKTVYDCAHLEYEVDCTGCEDCEDGITHYSKQAQDIFNEHFDRIESEYEGKGLRIT